MTELELLGQVLNLIDEMSPGQPHKLLWHYCGNSRRCRGSVGLPDLIITGQHGTIFAELKSDEGETTAEQDRWGYFLSGQALWKLWHPEDLKNGRIGRELVALL